MTTIEDASVHAPEFKHIGSRIARPDGFEKVTGRARFGADYSLPGMLRGLVLRSPHAHAWIKNIDTSKARALPGVKAIVTRDDFADQASEVVPAGELVVNYRDVVRNVMAREKALYDGHAVAAVAATSLSIARKALKLIDVEYELLPHVIDPIEASSPDAPLLHDFVFTEGVDPKPEKPSNVAKRVAVTRGMWRPDSPRPTSLSNANTTPSRCTRAILSPRPAWPIMSKTGRASSGPRPRDIT
jgi:CO/xanthine dehydrogenase Mo-binding subunit